MRKPLYPCVSALSARPAKVRLDRYAARLPLHLPILATLVAIASLAASVALLGPPGLARTLVPLSGGLLAGIAAFGLFPELVREIGRRRGLLLVAGGYLVLMAFDRFVHPDLPVLRP